MSYSRANPSPRYQALTSQYRQMHVEGERFLNIDPQETFPGFSLPAQAGRIKRLIDATGAQNILDYGSGKGRQYDLRNVQSGDGAVHESIQDYWDVDYVQCYDPCYEPFNKLPAGRFDGVICTDVLEHCPEEDVDWIVDELFGYAARFVFANVACYPAKKRLPSGENAHCTIKPLGWWRERLERTATKHPGVAWEVWVQWRAEAPEGPRLVEERLGSEPAAAR
jgi:hypothetical protein